MNLYYELLQYPVFSMKEVNALYSSERTARVALGKLLKGNMALKIRNGLYTCVSGENGGPVANRFQVASAITPSSYVSHHTAFEYYGTADQVFYEVYVGSQTRFHDFEFDGYTYHYVKEQMRDGIVSPEFSGGIKVTDKERTIVDSIKDLNRIAGLEEVLSCVVSVNSIDETKMLKYLSEYDSAFLYQKTGFILSEYQTELGISNEFIKICNNRSGNSKRYLTNGISEPGYSGEWKLVYPKNIKQMKNGGIEDAAI
jgi:predicted transcriptional regulator of viral defense system